MVIVDPSHYICHACGFIEKSDAFPYKAYGSVRCCPECGSTALEEKVIEGSLQ